MSTKVDPTAAQFFNTGPIGPDLQEVPDEIRELERVFGKAEQQDRDKFAQLTGVPQTKVSKPVKVVVKNKVFNLNKVVDSQLFSKLIQNPEKYGILQMEKNWGQDGGFRMWVLYSDSLDVRLKDDDIEQVDAAHLSKAE